MKDYSSNPVAAAYVAMYEKKVVERAKWVPEEITDEGAAEFMGAAANAAKKGDKTFKFGDKEYKVTMKKDTVDAITKNESVKEEDEVEVCEECGKVHEGACESGDKKTKEEVEEVAEPEAKGEKDFKDMHTKNTKKSGEKDDGTVVKENTKLQEKAVKVSKEPFKGNRDEKSADKVLTKAGFIFGRTPDMLSFETPGHFDPKTGLKVVIMQRGNQFAVSSADGSTIQRPSPIEQMVGWLRSNKYKV